MMNTPGTVLFETFLSCFYSMTCNSSLRLFQRYPQEHKDLFPCGTKENITSSCDRVKLLEELTELEQECLYFCQDSMLLEDQERKTKVLELLWMGVDGPGLGRSDEESDQEGPSMLVSNCHASFGELVERPCWTRVVNDRGVCFSTVPGTWTRAVKNMIL